MSLYFFSAKYSNAAFKGMVDTPQDWEAAASKLFNAMGEDAQYLLQRQQRRNYWNFGGQCRKHGGSGNGDYVHWDVHFHRCQGGY